MEKTGRNRVWDFWWLHANTLCAFPFPTEPGFLSQPLGTSLKALKCFIVVSAKPVPGCVSFALNLINTHNKIKFVGLIP